MWTSVCILSACIPVCGGGVDCDDDCDYDDDDHDFNNANDDQKQRIN